MTGDPDFRVGQPHAWTFQRATARWAYNVLEPPDPRPPAPAKEDLAAALVELPVPQPLGVTLEQAVAGRLSCRAYRAEGLTMVEVATMLRSAYGYIGRVDLGAIDMAERPVPSGGGLYPLEMYLVVRAVTGLDAGVFHYTPQHHALEAVRDGAIPSAFLTYLFMGQSCAAEAAAVLVQTAIPGRSLWKYGDRGYRYLLLEAGHVAQNVNLAALSLGLGTCNLGGFLDDELAGLLRVDIEREFAVYATALGRPAETGRAEQRAIAP